MSSTSPSTSASTEPPIEAVVFDWDGTLVDSKRALIASFQETTTEVQGEPFPTAPEDVERMIQIRGQEAFEEIAAGDRALYERIEEVFHRVYVAQQANIEPFPGALETLARLHEAGLRLGVATSKARRRLDLEAERSGIGALLDVSVSGDEVAVAKPDPEQVVAALAALGADPARSLYVGDGPNDVNAGRAAGAITVAVSFGFHPAEARAARPDHVIDTLPELLPLAGIHA
ncbi:MAG TPA: HAD family hydrolase [Solirubrobacterales bacterium]|nr:HAD family hydrolase [Solirubrobacterales bacterium]